MEEPKLEQFGLTKDQYDYLNKLEDKDYKVIMVSSVILGILAAVYFYYINPVIDPSIPKATIGRKLIWLFLLCPLFGGLGGAITGVIVSAIFTGIRHKFSRYFKKVSQYEAAIEKYNFWWVRNQELFWTSLSGKRFEYELAYLYSKLGYEVKLPIRGEPDKGIDFTLYKDGKKTIVQCKAHKNPVGPHIARDLYGTLVDSKADEAILASTSGFTSGVREYASGKQIWLISLADIIRMSKQIQL